jgi:hypothetical protein
LQHDAGGYQFYPNWGTTDAEGPMPVDYNWTYQLNQYELPFTTVRDKRQETGDKRATSPVSCLNCGSM